MAWQGAAILAWARQAMGNVARHDNQTPDAANSAPSACFAE